MALSSIVDHLSPEVYKNYKFRIVLFNLIKRAAILGGIFSILIPNLFLLVFSLVISIVVYLGFSFFENRTFDLMVDDVFDHMTHQNRLNSLTLINQWKNLIKEVSHWQMDRFPTRDLGECVVVLIVLTVGFPFQYSLICFATFVFSLYREFMSVEPITANRDSRLAPKLIIYGTYITACLLLLYGFDLPTPVEFLFVFSMAARICTSAFNFVEKWAENRKADSELISKLEALPLPRRESFEFAGHLTRVAPIPDSDNEPTVSASVQSVSLASDSPNFNV